MASSLDHMQYETKVQFTAGLNTEQKMPKNFRRTAIIATIGPKTNNVEALNALRKCGMNIVRMNCSHGDHAYHQSVIDNAREAQEVMQGRQLAIALDTKGPEIRTGNTVGDKDLPIKAGDEIIFTTDEKYAKACDTEHLYVDYKNFTKVIGERISAAQGAVKPPICVDDGKLEFVVLEIIDEQNLRAQALSDGYISSKKGVNLPDTDVDLPALSEKDIADLKFGVKNNIDMVFASFIRRGEDIRNIRKVLGEAGKHIQIIAKIENRQGLHNFAEIVKETDGVMVARGDLGIEIPYAEVYLAQKKMIAMCNLSGKPVICATQMLESMVSNPRATRAEISDVGNAVSDGADCVMLSGETAKGQYPKESVTAMHLTCLRAEGAVPYVRNFEEMCRTVQRPVSTVEACAMAAVRASLDMNAGAILVLSTSGESARLLAKYRPVCPIFMVTRNASASRYAHLYRGVYPFFFDEEKPDFNKVNWQEDVDRRIKWGIAEAFKLNVLSEGETVVVVQGWKGGMGNTNTIRCLTLEDPIIKSAVAEAAPKMMELSLVREFDIESSSA